MVDVNVIYLPRLTTSSREEKLYYILSIKPYPEKMVKSISELTLELYDQAQFKLLQIDLLKGSTAGGIRSVVDDSGKKTDLLFNHSTACSRDVYKSITRWSVGWTSK
jgi:hypothetical protein